MNLKFKLGMSVFLDTTVLCGALRVPNGVNRKILKLARASVFFKPVLSKVCLLEFYRNAINGLGRGGNKVCYTSNDILRFLNAFIYPILEEKPAVNSSVGRYSIETIIRENRPLGEVLSELSGCTNEEAYIICKQQEMQDPIKNFDQNDFHVWVTAIQQNCDVILTSNTKRFPSKIGRIERKHPVDFYKLIMDC